MKHWHPGETDQPPFVINNVLKIMVWVVLLFLSKLDSPMKCLFGQLISDVSVRIKMLHPVGQTLNSHAFHCCSQLKFD